MKQILVLSGKGGTGKTTIASAFVLLAEDRAFADCDVDAPNMHLLFKDDKKPVVEDYFGYKKAVKNYDLCINCGKCEELCQFGAIKNGRLNPYECEGCGVCEAFCPVFDKQGKKAIRLEPNVSGRTMLYNSDSKNLFSTAELEMGNGASGKLVTQVRKNLYNSIEKQSLAIIDGSPGIGCPVIASITGVDIILIVAEPTISGIHDLNRIVQTTKQFDCKCIVCINKFDVNLRYSEEIKEYCVKENIDLVGRIPFDIKVIEALNSGKSIVHMENSPAKESIISIWEEILNKNIKENGKL